MTAKFELKHDSNEHVKEDGESPEDPKPIKRTVGNREKLWVGEVASPREKHIMFFYFSVKCLTQMTYKQETLYRMSRL